MKTIIHQAEMEERSENSVIPHSLSRQTNNLYHRWFQSMKKMRQHLNLPRIPPAKDLALKRKNKLISILSNKCLDSMKLIINYSRDIKSIRRPKMDLNYI